MSFLAHKIRDGWIALGFELELFFERIFSRKKMITDSKPDGGPNSGLEGAPSRVLVQPKEAVKIEKREKIKKETNKLSWSLRMLRLSGKERLFFFDQLATLIDSGVTLIPALTIIQRQAKSGSLKKIYAQMIHDINGGMGLAQSMRGLPHLFPEMMSALVEAGEKSGNLKTVLAELTEEMEGHQDFVRKVTGAMFYPAILIVMCITLITGMMLFVIPKISSMYKDANVSLPVLTQKVIALSQFVSMNWKFLFLGVAGILLFLWSLVHFTRFGRFLWESFTAYMPIFGKIATEKQIMIFSANLGMLMQSGVLITDALEITAKTMGSLHYEQELSKIRQGVMMGQGMSEMMGLVDLSSGQDAKRKSLFPLQVAQLVHIGETTGKIGKMLLKVRSNYKKSIDYTLKNLSSVIEPLMIFVVAALVGSTLLAVMLPFFYIGTTIK
ncbi:type II secretion system F family protein [Candidatus Peregrinibacteria bacterium]|nr:type II secretion system F family protein [Candidatus Peregrinibacteria bacterium]